MESRVYYGEYSLKHWIDLMLMRNIELPEYQRSFVWDEKDVKRLIKSLDDGQFVQPITIAHYNCDGEERNLILDGQQRLTSILLALLGYMPDKEKFEKGITLAEGDDSIGEEEDDQDSLKAIKWTFVELLNNKVSENKPNQILKRLNSDGRYYKIQITTKQDIDKFFENTFLGFSYIIPETKDSNEAQKFFSTLFRNMNYLGKRLSLLESRRSLYYLNNRYKRYFEGLTKEEKDVLCDIELIENMQPHKIDFVRYLAILSQYIISNSNPKSKKVMVGFSSYSSREGYYTDYVSYILNLEQESRVNKFDGFNITQIFPDDCWQERFDKLRDSIDSLKEHFKLDVKRNAFTSWVDADYWLFGLLYWMVFEGKDISLERYLIETISKRIIKIREEKGDYSKNPNRLGNLRERLQESIDIYKKYAK